MNLDLKKSHISADASESSDSAASISFRKNKAAVCAATLSYAAGDLIERIAVRHLPGVVDNDDRDVQLVRKSFQR